MIVPLLILSGLVGAGVDGAAPGRARAHELRRRLDLAETKAIPLTFRDRVEQAYRLLEKGWASEAAFMALSRWVRDQVGYGNYDCWSFDRVPVNRQHYAREPYVGMLFCLPKLTAVHEGGKYLAWAVRWLVDDLFLDDPGHRDEEVHVAFRRDFPLIVDWATATSPDLYSMRWAEAVAAATAWHRALAVSVSTGTPVPPAFCVLKFPDGSRIDRLLGKADFAAEGTSMGHCVGGLHDDRGQASGDSRYRQASDAGRGSILSYRNAEGIPRWTLELSLNGLGSGAIVQLEGPVNQPADPLDARFFLALWVESGRSLAEALDASDIGFHGFIFDPARTWYPVIQTIDELKVAWLDQVRRMETDLETARLGAVSLVGSPSEFQAIAQVGVQVRSLVVLLTRSLFVGLTDRTAGVRGPMFLPDKNGVIAGWGFDVYVPYIGSTSMSLVYDVDPKPGHPPWSVQPLSSSESPKFFTSLLDFFSNTFHSLHAALGLPSDPVALLSNATWYPDCPIFADLQPHARSRVIFSSSDEIRRHCPSTLAPGRPGRAR